MDYKGLSIETEDSIYEPAEDSFLAAELIEEQLGATEESDLDIIDIGTGTGILGMVAARSTKVAAVTFADINKGAIVLAKRNVSSNEKFFNAGCHFIVSDLFIKVKGKFDLIIFNAPYLRRNEDEDNSIDLVSGEKGIELTLKFIDYALLHMKPNARIILVASSLSEFEALQDYIKENGLKVLERKKLHIFFEDILVLLMAKA